MKVDTIIVAHNSGHWLQTAVRSALAASGVGDVLVVDNASDDRAADAIGGLDRVKVLSQANNLGFGKACNLAARHSQAEFLLLLNPDCQLAADDVVRLLANFSADQVALVSAQLLNADGSEQVASLRFDPTPQRLIKQALGGQGVHQSPPIVRAAVSVEGCSGALMLIRKSVFDALGGFDEAYFLHWEDLDLCKRLRLAGYQIIVDTRVRVRHDKGTSSLHTRKFVSKQKYLGMLRYFQKFHATQTSIWLRGLFYLGARFRYWLTR
jgi:N-acetylglucosaminyl-diphospho-decaprenol L-rhamnosyltransferase